MEENEKKNGGRSAVSVLLVDKKRSSDGCHAGSSSEVNLDAALNSDLDAAFDSACNAGFKG